MFKEFGGGIFKRYIMHRNFKSHIHQVQCIHTHPACSVCLFEFHFTMQLNATVEHSNVIKPEKAPFKNVVPIWVFSVDPPCEIDNLFLKNAFKKSDIPLSGFLFFYVIYLQCSPCMYRWIYVTKVPLISR